MNVNRAELATALNRAASATGTMLPVTANIRLETTDGLLTVTGTNLDVTVEVTIPAKGKLGPVLAPAHIARQVAALTSETVDLTVKSGKLVVEGNATFRLPTFPIDDWPTIDPPTGGHFEPAQGFVERFAAVASHVSTEQARPLLRAVAYGGGMLRATDSYRAAVVDEDGPDETLIIPAVKLAHPVDRIDFDRRHVMFTTPEGRMWVRMVEGSFPDVTKIIPKAGGSTVTVDADVLSRAFGRAQMVPIAATRGVRMDHDGDGVRLSVVDASGEFEEFVPAKVDGEFEPVAFRPEFMRDALAPVAGDVELTIQDGRKPAMVSKGWWRSVVMPIVQN